MSANVATRLEESGKVCDDGVGPAKCAMTEWALPIDGLWVVLVFGGFSGGSCVRLVVDRLWLLIT